MTNWSKLILDVQREARISQRKLSVMSGVNRATLRKLVAGEPVPFDLLERVLNVLGYELVASYVAPPRKPPPDRRCGVRKKTLLMLAGYRMKAK